jgi:hypothetical protein
VPGGGRAGTFATTRSRLMSRLRLLPRHAVAHGNRRLRVVSVVPVERIAEFVDEPAYGVLVVEPV